MFPKIGVPENGWFIVDSGKSYVQMDDLGGNTPIFGHTHIQQITRVNWSLLNSLLCSNSAFRHLLLQFWSTFSCHDTFHFLSARFLDDRGRGPKEQIRCEISGSYTSSYNLLSREGFDWVNFILDYDAHLDIRLTIPPKSTPSHRGGTP